MFLCTYWTMFVRASYLNYNDKYPKFTTRAYKYWSKSRCNRLQLSLKHKNIKRDFSTMCGKYIVNRMTLVFMTVKIFSLRNYRVLSYKQFYLKEQGVRLRRDKKRRLEILLKNSVIICLRCILISLI